MALRQKQSADKTCGDVRPLGSGMKLICGEDADHDRDGEWHKTTIIDHRVIDGGADMRTEVTSTEVITWEPFRKTLERLASERGSAED